MEFELKYPLKIHNERFAANCASDSTKFKMPILIVIAQNEDGNPHLMTCTDHRETILKMLEESIERIKEGPKFKTDHRDQK